MLGAALLEEFRALSDKIVEPVVLAATLDESAASTQVAGVLDDLATASLNLSVEHRNTADRSPSFLIERVGTDVSVEFAGIPLGEEFNSLVLAILQVGGHPPRIAPNVVDAIRALDVEMQLETFFSLSCRACPEVVQSLNTISIVNPRIRHTAIQGGTYAEEARQRNVQGAPTVFRDGEIFQEGRIGLKQILAKLGNASP